jgi:hypothetical protein
MTRERTDKSKYKHHTTGEYCTCAAYIAERMCLNHAQYKNIGSLPYKFWNTKSWNWSFKKQITLANRLINQYGETPVIKAVLSKEFERIFSLNNKKGISIIKGYFNQRDLKVDIPPPEIIENPTFRSTSFKKKSALSRIREIELNGKKEESN